MHVWKVGIVGGGPGGLMTAYALQKQANCPLRVTLFEASSRLGGKILTPQFRAAPGHLPVRYEAGAAEFYDYSQFDDDPLKDLIAELGLPIRPMGGPAVVMNQQVLANQDDIRDHLGPQASRALLAFDRLAKDQMTPREFYYADDLAESTPLDAGRRVAGADHRFDAVLQGVKDSQARHYVENLIHSDLAAEPRQTSQGYGLQNYLMNDPAYMHLYGIEGGNERLPQALAARLCATILLEHQVQRVAKDGNRLRISSVRCGETRHDDFDFVVIALPHNHVSSVEYCGELLAGAIQQHQAHYDHPAHYLRITILFDRPFWRNAFTDSYWMLDQFGGCCLYDESSRDPHCPQGVLGWLVGGDAARDMSQLSDKELIEAALYSLPDFLAKGRLPAIEGRVHRWIAAVNALPGGVVPKNLDRRHQPEPLEHPNLYLVGDYLFDSTLNGVLDSAEYVASWLAAQMADHPE